MPPPNFIWSCEVLERALKLLQEEGASSLAPDLQTQIDETLEEITPRCVLELLSLPLDEEHQRRWGKRLRGVHNILWAVEDGGATAVAGGFTHENFMKEAFLRMTAAEQDMASEGDSFDASSYSYTPTTPPVVPSGIVTTHNQCQQLLLALGGSRPRSSVPESTAHEVPYSAEFVDEAIRLCGLFRASGGLTFGYETFPGGVSEWLHQCESVFASMDITPVQMQYVASFQLSGIASTLWSLVAMSLVGYELTWAQFRVWIEHTFEYLEVRFPDLYRAAEVAVEEPRQQRPFAFFTCGSPNHSARLCPQRPQQQHITEPAGRVPRVPPLSRAARSRVLRRGIRRGASVSHIRRCQPSTQSARPPLTPYARPASSGVHPLHSRCFRCLQWGHHFQVCPVL